MQTTGLSARVGRTTYPVTSWQQVSTAYRRTIETLDLGASQAPRCEIVDMRGNVIAHVAYNGRVFPGRTYEPGATPLYEPPR